MGRGGSPTHDDQWMKEASTFLSAGDMRPRCVARDLRRNRSFEWLWRDLLGRRCPGMYDLVIDRMTERSD